MCKGRGAQRIDYVAVYTSRFVQRDAELFVHYGNGYSHRTWKPGKATHISKAKILPPVYWLANPPADAFRFV